MVSCFVGLSEVSYNNLAKSLIQILNRLITVSLESFLPMFLRNVDHATYDNDSQRETRHSGYEGRGKSWPGSGVRGAVRQDEFQKEQIARRNKKVRKNEIVKQHCSGESPLFRLQLSDLEYFSQPTALSYVTNSCALLRNRGYAVGT